MTVLEQGKTCWRIAPARRLSVIVDADAYFNRAREALLKAQRRIMLIGWDFDARIALTRGERLPDEPESVGEFLLWLVERTPTLEIFLLRWDVGALKTLGRGSTMLTVAKWMMHPRIHTKLDGHHPPAASHHQKIVSIDDRFGFCGGIDMTGSRWDTRAHRDDDPGRKRPGGQPYVPWHDATLALSGAAAEALAEQCRNRWHRAGGHAIDPVDDGGEAWPDTLDADFRDIDIGIARSIPKMDDEDEVIEIEALFVAMIAAAQRSVYLESQYFASRRVAEAIAQRLDEADGPEFVIINPHTAQGWLEPVAMDSARARLVAALNHRDAHQRLRLFHPVTTAGAPIYVHAKIAIVDDRILRVGSANLNNRSMRLDTECDIALDASAADPAVRARIAAMRDDLLAEHLGCDAATVAATVARTGSLIAAVDELRGAGRTLVPYETPDISAVEEWLADNEVLDPEGPDEMFEALNRPGLLHQLRRE